MRCLSLLLLLLLLPVLKEVTARKMRRSACPLAAPLLLQEHLASVAATESMREDAWMRSAAPTSRSRSLSSKHSVQCKGYTVGAGLHWERGAE